MYADLGTLAGLGGARAEPFEEVEIELGAFWMEA
jgi:hypothetical protein